MDRLHEPTKTDIPKIDRWLEEPHLSGLYAILSLEERRFEGKILGMDKGFKDAEEVRRYVYMLAPALDPETRANASPDEVRAPSLSDELKGRMVGIKGGSFTMGDTDKGTYEAEVVAFEIDKYPVTQSLYRKVMGANPSYFEGEDRPVVKVSWFDAVEFCNRLSGQMGYSPAYNIKGKNVDLLENSNGFRLPSEAEWEYACRAGATNEDDRDYDLDRIAWYDANSGDESHGVGQKEANEWGLYDMLGNVREWCWDWYGAYPSKSTKDYTGPSSGPNRVVRGGGWGYPARYCRSAIRGYDSPDNRSGVLGFRLSRSVKP